MKLNIILFTSNHLIHIFCRQETYKRLLQGKLPDFKTLDWRPIKVQPHNWMRLNFLNPFIILEQLLQSVNNVNCVWFHLIVAFIISFSLFQFLLHFTLWAISQGNLILKIQYSTGFEAWLVVKITLKINEIRLEGVNSKINI